ncbi:hypothetical protein OG204_18830 [Streptomyces sp. NBC_01387]|uniref:hypothetical protein n=1 Tax=Streptomyces sp. NBC_01387 TaxID=2903849 RepID=UPI003254BCBA
MAYNYFPRTDLEQLIVDVLLEIAVVEAADLPNSALVGEALHDAAQGKWDTSPRVRQVMVENGRGAHILDHFQAHSRWALDKVRALVPPPSQLQRPSDDDWSWPPELPEEQPLSPIESAEEALKRGAVPQILNEILASGAVASSFAAAASIAKAKIEATTQRRKNDLDAEIERLRIASEERIAGFRPMTAQGETEDPGLDEASA